MAATLPVRRSNWYFRCLCCFAALVFFAFAFRAAFPLLVVRMARVQGARLTPEQASYRIASLYNHLEGACDLLAPPAFLDKRRFADHFGAPHTSAWLGSVGSNGRTIHLEINDATGNLVYFHDVTDDARASQAQRSRAPVESAAQAAMISVSTLRALDLALPCDRIALAKAPAQRSLHGDWSMVWRVMAAKGSAPTAIKICLSAHDGRLLEAFNARERYETIQR